MSFGGVGYKTHCNGKLSGDRRGDDCAPSEESKIPSRQTGLRIARGRRAREVRIIVEALYRSLDARTRRKSEVVDFPVILEHTYAHETRRETKHTGK